LNFLAPARSLILASCFLHLAGNISGRPGLSKCAAICDNTKFSGKKALRQMAARVEQSKVQLRPEYQDFFLVLLSFAFAVVALKFMRL